MLETKNRLTTSLAVDEEGNKVIWISFPYDLEMIMNVRKLPGRKYHPDFKCWSAPIHRENLRQLREWDFSIDPRLENYIHKQEEKDTPIVRAKIPGLRGKLYPFQKKGVAFIERKDGRALIADEMGLGKTVQALAWLQLHPEKRPAIVICPASVKLGWVREALTWMTHPNVEVLIGKTPWKTRGDVIVMNYDILSKDWIVQLRKINPQVLITDECHYFKNNSANRTKMVKLLAKNIPHIIALSGTPILSRPSEAYNAIRLIAPKIFPSYADFADEYCNRKPTPFGWDDSGSSNTDKLHSILVDTIMLRRLKADVLKELPPKQLSYVPILINNEYAYRAAEADFIGYIEETKGDKAARRAERAKQFAEIEGLKQLSMKGKLKEAIHWIREFLEVGEEKLVVFAIHKFVIDALMEEFKDIAVKVDGSVSTSKREKAKNDFQNNPAIRLFVGNIKAAGVGLTLTAASNAVILELPWTPGDLTQAEDRIHRITQSKSVTIHYLLASNTIEEKLSALLDEKRKTLDAVLDGKETSKESLLEELMKMYEN